jgi:hypothetical protein
MSFPEIDIVVGTNGLTIYCPRFTTPRLIPFDIKGKCKTCRGDAAEVDFAVTKEGITLTCTRITGEKFVKFDDIYEIPDKCLFRVRNKGRGFIIPYKRLEKIEEKNEKEVKQEIKEENKPNDS